MLHYPKIPGSRNSPSGRCLAFEKYDGTNLHWDWDRDFGWHAFGTRRDQFNLLPAGVAEFTRTHEHLREAPTLFVTTLAEGLERLFRGNDHYRGFNVLKVFTEFLGPNSFAGLHRTDDPKRLVLFDVWAEGFGMVGPRQFVDDFGSLPIARVVYDGRLTGRFAEDVRTGKFGDDLKAVRSAMEKLARAYRPKGLAGKAYSLYEEFRPAIPAGKRGWGATGDLDPGMIERLAREKIVRAIRRG